MSFGRSWLVASLLLIGLVELPGAATAEVKVVVTIKPVHALVAGVMAGHGTPHLLIDGAGSPHTFALKPSDAKALSGSRLVVRVSDNLEVFLNRVVKGLPRATRVLTLDKAKGMTLHPMREGGAFEGHDHSHSHNHDHAHGGIDGHLWLDPRNAQVIVDAVRAALAEIDPANSAAYATNAARLKDALKSLESEIAAATSGLKGRAFVVFHDAYQYFERRFDLTVAGSITVSPEIAPSAKRLSALRRRITSLGATCVFSEPQFEPRLVQTVTEGTKARAGVLDPLGAAIPAGPELYGQLMRELARGLRSCLAPGS